MFDTSFVARLRDKCKYMIFFIRSNEYLSHIRDNRCMVLYICYLSYVSYTYIMYRYKIYLYNVLYTRTIYNI